MSLAVDVLLILIPFVLGIILLVFFKFKADTVGTILIILMLIIGIFYFLTEWKFALLASLAGIIKSFPISLMVLTSILMITYQQKTGALDKIVVSFKKIGGGNKAFQIMMINLAIGCFLVSIGATPVTMLPPVLMAMGYSAFASVALPAIGYAPLTTYALLAVPAEFFAFFMKDTLLISQIDQLSLLSNHIIEPELVASGIAFSFYMPLVTIGIALGMLWLGGGRKLLFSKDGIIFGLTAGITAVGTANGVGGGLASVLSPAKIQNAAAVIDRVGIEGEVIKKAAPVAFLMTLSVSAVCLCWANAFVWWQWLIVFGIFMAIIAIIGTLLYFHKGKEES